MKKIIALCEGCGEEIKEGAKYYNLEKTIFGTYADCTDCHIISAIEASIRAMPKEEEFKTYVVRFDENGNKTRRLK